MILGSESTRLPENINLDTIQSSTGTAPPVVEKFVQNLDAGPDIQSWKSHTKKLQIKCIRGDLFPTSYGR